MQGFQPDDFKNMRWKIFGLKKGVLETFPDLKIAIPSLARYTGPHLDKLVRYALFMYDAGSALISRYPDLQMRKENAADLAGFDADKDGEWLSENVYQFDNPEILDIVHELLQYQNNRLWSLIVSNENTFSEYNKMILDPIKKNTEDGAKDPLQAMQLKGKLMADIDLINQRLETYYSKFYGDDLLMKKDTIKRLTPETIANLK
jgi:hypothetical protein